MQRAPSRAPRKLVLGGAVALVTAFAVALAAAAVSAAGSTPRAPGPVFSKAAAFDVSKPLTELAGTSVEGVAEPTGNLRAGLAPTPLADTAHFTDGALQAPASPAPAIPSPIANFEGLSNQDN